MTRLFTIKCLLLEYPVAIISILSIYSTLVLSYMLRIIEYDPPVNDHFIYPSTPANHVKSFESSLWYIYVTFLTIGYGEYMPNTNLGRAIAIFAALLGTFLVSLLAVTIQEYYNLKAREVNVKLCNIDSQVHRSCWI
jgi:hypothetical protein